MGMGYGANFAYVIPTDDVRKIVPIELEALFNRLRRHDIHFDTFAQAVQFDMSLDDVSKEVEEGLFQAYEFLVKLFKEKTGIDLYLSFHDSENDGDRYDDVNGGFFELGYGDVIQETPEAQALRNNGVDFGVRFYVTYG